VVTVYGADKFEDRIGICMEFVKGRTLEQLVQTHGPFGAREAAIIGLDLCAALAAVHAAGLVHGDVKALNVMREDGGRTLLMDFGAGRPLKGGHAETFVGTPSYLAPETFGAHVPTPALDLYALGVLLFYLVAKTYPVESSTVAGIIEAHRNGMRRRLRDVRPDLPKAFVRIVERALATEPRERYATAGAFEAELSRFLGGHVVDATPARKTAHLALRPTSHFVGREQDLQRLRALLNESSAVAITALGGTGKTTLARMYAEQFSSEYTQILWIEAHRGYESELASLCEIVLPEAALNVHNMPAIDKARRVLTELENARGVRLLVIDNAEDEVSVTPWWPKTGAVQTLITSRYAHWDAIPTYPLAVLDPTAACSLLLVRSGHVDTGYGDERAACDDLVERLGYLPLALEQAAAYIRKQGPGFGFRDYLRLFGDAERDLLSLSVRGTTDYPASVFKTWRTTIDKLPAGARFMLRLAAFLAPTGIPLGLFHDSAEELTKLVELEFPDGAPTNANGIAEFRVRSWRQTLAEYSLITLTAGETFAIHPLVQAVERDQLDRVQYRRYIKAAVEILLRHVPEDPYYAENWKHWYALVPHAEVLYRLAQPTEVQLDSALLRGLSHFYRMEGRHAAAIPFASEAVAQDERLLGPEHPNTLKSVAALGLALAFNGDQRAAESRLRRALSARERVLGPEHRDTLWSVTELAFSLRVQGDLETAERLLRGALETRERVFGPEHPDTLANLNQLATVLLGRDDHLAAEQLYRQVLSVRERVLGSEHRDTLWTVLGLAEALEKQGQCTAAEPLYRRAYQGFEQAVGIEHPGTRQARDGLERCRPQLDEET
jgi:tetratricopeptide (TPR) repeat protein